MLHANYSIDKFFNRVSTRKYNCLDFVREVWADMTGVDIAEALPGLQGDFSHRKGSLSGRKTFRRLESPVSPCIAVFQRRGDTPHLGIFYLGRILHLHERGVEFQPVCVAKAYYTKVRYYV